MSTLARRYSYQLGWNCRRTTGQFRLYHRFDVVDTYQDVFRLEVRMNDPTLSMQVVESEQHLLCNLLDDMLRHSAMLIPFD